VHDARLGAAWMDRAAMQDRRSGSHPPSGSAAVS
jgi:hypothetical protein